MKNTILGSSALVALIFGLTASTVPASAANGGVSGYVGVNFGATWSEYFDGKTANGSSFVFGGEGRANAWLSGDMSVQLDAEAEATTSIKYNTSSSAHDGRISGIFGGHISWRDPNSHLVGLFGGFSGANNLDYDGTMTHGLIGVEGQYYLNHQVTLYGQAGYAPLMSDSNDYEPKGVWFLRAVGRYFLTDNDRLQAEFGYAQSGGIVTDNGQFNIYNWGASWEHRLSNSPFAVGLEYAGFQSTTSDDIYRATEHVFLFSMKIHFGDSSLHDEDRDGATLDMPKFERAFPWSERVG